MRKRQTRLGFTPVPSSSPRSEAHIRINDASRHSKRRRTDDADSDALVITPDIARAIALSKEQDVQVVVPSPRTRDGQLPTPAASSQIDAIRDEGR